MKWLVGKPAHIRFDISQLVRGELTSVQIASKCMMRVNGVEIMLLTEGQPIGSRTADNTVNAVTCQISLIAYFESCHSAA